METARRRSFNLTEAGDKAGWTITESQAEALGQELQVTESEALGLWAPVKRKRGPGIALWTEKVFYKMVSLPPDNTYT